MTIGSLEVIVAIHRAHCECCFRSGHFNSISQIVYAVVQVGQRFVQIGS